jgi:hypothetical protein
MTCSQRCLVELTFKKELLDRLKPVYAARHDASDATSACLQGTRKAVLEDTESWFKDASTNAPFALLVAGIAGTGKTAIAHSVCMMLEKHLGATFFFSRDSIERRRPANVIPTLAYQLAYTSADIRQRICTALTNTPDIATRALQVQAQKLFAEALGTIDGQHMLPILVVIDALDECDKEAGQEGGQLIPLLFHHLSSLPFRVKVLITSRPEASIIRMQEKLTSAPRPFILHDIEKQVVNTDIEFFLRDECSKIADAKYIEEPWPAEEQMAKLVTKSDRLFIYAATAVRFIGDALFPKEALEIFLSAVAADVHTSHVMLDSVYRTVVQSLANQVQTSNSDRTFVLFRRVVGAIVVAQQPLSRRVISRLLREDANTVHGVLSPLYSVLDVGPGLDRPIRTFHLSFPDFITDQKRCGDDRVYIRTEEAHLFLFLECLRVMNEQLRKNICEIEDPGLFNTEVKDLAGSIERHISEELRYACVYWMDHLVQAEAFSEEMTSALSTFCHAQLLPWLEALSLTGHLRAAVEGIPRVIGWLKVCVLGWFGGIKFSGR